MRGAAGEGERGAEQEQFEGIHFVLVLRRIGFRLLFGFRRRQFLTNWRIHGACVNPIMGEDRFRRQSEM